MTSLNQNVYFPYFQYDFNLTQELISNERFSDHPVLGAIEKIFKVFATTLTAAFESLKNGIKFVGNGVISLINLGYRYNQKDRTTRTEAAAAILYPDPVPDPIEDLPKTAFAKTRASHADPEILRLRWSPSL